MRKIVKSFVAFPEYLNFSRYAINSFWLHILIKGLRFQGLLLMNQHNSTKPQIKHRLAKTLNHLVKNSLDGACGMCFAREYRLQVETVFNTAFQLQSRCFRLSSGILHSTRIFQAPIMYALLLLLYNGVLTLISSDHNL